jgi:outer membrane receptor for ferrienterochelin and colicins
MSPYLPLRLTLIAAALSAALSAHAQQTAPAAPEAKPAAKPADDKLQQVEIKGSADAYNPRRDDTASKIVVSSEEILKYGDTNVMDVLKRVPGITVTGAAGRSGGEIRMRGLGSGYTQILINGERAPAGFSMDSLAPDVIERIEVLRAASAEFSTQSIAGTINIVLKKAIKNAQREIKAGFGAGDGFFNPTLNLQLSDKVGKMSYSLSANAFHQQFDRESPTYEEGFNPAGALVMRRNSATKEDGRFDALNIGPRLNWNLDGGDTLTWQSFLNINHFKRNAHTLVTTPVGAAPVFVNTDSTMMNDNKFVRSDLNWVHKLTSGAKLDLKIGGVYGLLRNDLARLAYGSEPGKLIFDSVVTSRATDYGYTTTGKFSTPVFEGHALAMGWDGGVNTRDDERIQRESAPPRAPGLPKVFPVNSDEYYTGDVTRLAAYVQDEWNVTPRWSLYLGARWEGIETKVTGNTFADAKSRTSVWSPVMQTLYKLPNSKGDQIRFAVTRTYKAPNTQSLIPRRFTSVNNSSTEPDFAGNPDLKPELALGFDASFEHYFAEGALLSISTSMRKIDGYTRNATTLGADGRWVTMPSNGGDATTRGLELEAKFPLKAVMKDAPPIDLRASISRNWSTVDSVPGPNNRLDSQTPFSATLGADYKNGAFSAGGSYAFRNGGPVRISMNQTAYQTVRRDLEVYGLWKFDPKNQLRVALSNILKQDFINENTYTDQSGSVRRVSAFPGVVVLRATMEMKF